MPLPVDITTDAGTKRILLGSEGITVKSSTQPIVDGKGNYFKKISIE